MPRWGDGGGRRSSVAASAAGELQGELADEPSGLGNEESGKQASGCPVGATGGDDDVAGAAGS